MQTTTGISAAIDSLRRVIGTLLVALSLWAAVPAATAQPSCFPGDFFPLDPRFLGLGGVRGILPVVSGGTVSGIALNTTPEGAPTLPGPTFDLPIEARGATNYFLSPSRRFVLAISCPNIPANCGPSEPGRQSESIAILRFPASGTEMQLVHTDCLPSGLLNDLGRWYEQGLCVPGPDVNSPRVCTAPPHIQIGHTTCTNLFMARTSDASGNAILCWYDLADTTPSTIDGRARTQLSLQTNEPDAGIDAGGNLYFIRHGINPVLPNQQYQVALIDVCPGSATFGQDRIAGDPRFANLTSANPIVSPAAASCAPTALTVNIQRITLSGTTVLGTTTLPLCCAAQPVTGRCCSAASGACSITTRAGCPSPAGTWTAGGTCTTSCPPPAPVLRLLATGPSTASVSVPLTHSFTVSNAGFATANNVRIEMQLPSSQLASFVSASAGSVSSFSSVSWTLPTLAPGSSATVSITLRPLCLATIQTFNISARVNATNAPILITSTPTISVATQTPPTGGITATLTGSPSANPPLFPGDEITYTLTITNQLPEPRFGIQFTAHGTQNTLFNRSINPGPGTLTLNAFQAFWIGDLPPSSTSTIVFTARVADCPRPGFDLGIQEALSQLQILNPCSTVVGTAQVPPLSPIGQTAGITLSPANGSDVAFTAGSGSARLRLSVTNPRAIAQSIGAAISLPGTVVVNDPPFVATPPPAGFAWDSQARVLSFSGVVAPGASAVCEFDAGLDASVRCSTPITASGGAGTCTNLSTSLALTRLNPLPVEPHLIGFDYIDGLWWLRPGIDTVQVPLWCFNFTGSGGGSMARGPQGEFYLSSPLCRFDPVGATVRFYHAPASGIPIDLAFDPSTGGLIFLYSDRVERFDPITETASPLIAAPPGVFLDDPLVLGGDGRIAFKANQQMVIVDARPPVTLPLAPGAWTSVPMPPANFLGGQTGVAPTVAAITTDAAGDYVVASRQNVPSLGTAVTLVKVEHASLSTSVLVPAVSGPAAVLPLTTSFIPTLSIAIDSAGDGYFGTVVPGALDRVSPAATPPVQRIFNSGPGAIDLIASPVGVFSAGPATCPAEFNGDGTLNPDDLGDFISCYFNVPPCPGAEFNGDGNVNSDDLGDYITAYFAGCP